MEREMVCGVPWVACPARLHRCSQEAFFYRWKLVRNAEAGDFDEEQANTLLNLQTHWSQKTAGPLNHKRVRSSKLWWSRLGGSLSIAFPGFEHLKKWRGDKAVPIITQVFLGMRPDLYVRV
jgi:hypothetical protein